MSWNSGWLPSGVPLPRRVTLGGGVRRRAPVELAGGALVQGARPGVGDSLPGDDALPRRMCQVGL